MKDVTPHLDDLALQSLFDQELEDGARRAAEAHLGVCSQCADRLAEHERLRGLLAASAPGPELFASDGEAWVRLAGSLAHGPARSPQALPWLPVVPSLVFGAVGTAIEILLSGVLLVYALVGLGLLPPLASGVAGWLASLIASPMLEQYVFSWLGTSTRATLLAPLQRWQAMPQGIQEGLFVSGLILALGALLAIVLGIYFSWTMGWSRLASANGRKGG